MLISLDHLVKKSIEKGIQVNIAKTYGSVIAHNRNKIARMVAGSEADYLLFIDSDMVFEPDALIRLLNHQRDIVSGLAVTRKHPHHPVAKDLQEDGGYIVRKGLDEGRFFSDIDMVGCAFLLIKTSVLKDVGEPWFACPPYKNSVMGEDVYFCRLAKEKGYDICIDTSLTIGHIGDYIYTIEDYVEETAEESKKV